MATSDCTRGAQGLYNEAVIALPVAPPAPCASDGDISCLDGTTLERRAEPPDWYYQPRLVDPYDADFGSTPLLFDRDGKKYLGIGGKDGFYYVIERQRSGVPDTYRLPLWSRRVVMGGFAGGFIGSTATDGTRIWGATAMFDIPTEAQSTFLTPNPFAQPPFLHAFDAATGDLAWQQLGPGPTFGATTTTNDVIFVASLDSLVMALDGETGQVLWSAPVLGPASSGVAISGDEIFLGSGTEAQGMSLPLVAGINAFVLVDAADEMEGMPPKLPPSPWPLEEPVRYPLVPEESTPHPGPTPTP
jgi:outer membrane protein assembly factor BamB